MGLKKSSKALVDEAMALIRTESLDRARALHGFKAWKEAGAPVVEKPKGKPAAAA